MRRTSWLRTIYIVLSYLLVPLLLLHLYWRSLNAPAYRQRIGERFGLGLARQRRSSIWVHAVSVGEVQAAAPLVRALLKRHPDVPLVMTTMTPTGSERVRLLFGDAVVHSYVPYDLAAPVRWFFDRTRPSLAIIMETELWPNLYHECAQRRVPLVLASARISARSLGRYRRLLPLFRDMLDNGIVIAAQTPADAERFRSLGANPAQTHVTGNIKFDFELPSDVLHAGRALRTLQAADRPVWVAASTHEGEEAVLLAAHVLIRQQHPRAMLFLVPRHPERFSEVAELIESCGLAHVTRSSAAVADQYATVFLGDTMGELMTFYAAADVAFVGGSLSAIGGHNLLEPASLGIPVITGPHNENAADIFALLVACGAASVALDVADVAAEVCRLFSDPEERQRRGAAGQAAITDNNGALERLLRLIEPLVPDDAG